MAIREVRRADVESAQQRRTTFDRVDAPHGRPNHLELVEGGRESSLHGDVSHPGSLHVPELRARVQRVERSGGRRLVDVALLSVLDMMPMGVMLIDHARRVVRMNERARALVSAIGALSVGADGRCHARQGQNESRFQQALGAALAGADAVGDLRFVALSASEGRAPLIAQLCTVEVGDAYWVAVYLFGEHAQLSASAQALRSVFGLTAAESELAVALAYGSTLSEYARTRGITINTVKTQLRGALSKTATRRQSALIRLILLQLPCISDSAASARSSA